MEEYFEDPSFIYYLIDNVERAMNNSQGDLEEYLSEIREKTMKKYVKALKKDFKNEKSVSLLKKLGTMFTMGHKSNDVKIQPVTNPFKLVKEESEKMGESQPETPPEPAQDKPRFTLSQLKLADLPAGLKESESKSNFKF